MSSEPNNANLAWQSEPLRELIRLAWPIATSLLSYSVMTVVDAMFVARLGASSIAATGLGGTAFFTIACFGIGVFSGVKVLISRAVGAGERQHLEAMLGGALRLAVLLGLGGALVGIAVAWLLPWASGDVITGPLARRYCSIRSLGMPAVLLACAVSQYRQALGDSRSAMRAALIANVVHIPLNACLIFGLQLGVSGAASATALCACLEAALLLIAQQQEGLGWHSASHRTAWALFRYSYATGIERWLDVAAFAALVVLIARLGATELAAHQICLQILHFCFLPMVALGDAVCVLVAQSMGAGLRRSGQRVIRHGLLIGLVFGTTCALVLTLWDHALVRLFTKDAMVISATDRVLRAAVGLQFVNVAFTVVKGALRGLGQLRFVASVAVACAWLLTPPLTWVFGYHFAWGAAGGWAALMAEIAVGTLVFSVRLWRTLRAGSEHPSSVASAALDVPFA